MTLTVARGTLKGVDGRLVDIMDKAAQAFERAHPGFHVEVISGLASRKSGTRNHPTGRAIDVQIIGPDNKVLPNKQHAPSFRAYEELGQLGRLYQTQKYPDLNNKYRMGAYFKQGVPFDQMHYDISGGGMAYGTWEGGLTKEGRRALPGAKSVGMSAFPSAPAGPRQKETGPGIYGALSAADLAREYAKAGNMRLPNRAPAPAAIPQSSYVPPERPSVGGLGVPAAGGSTLAPAIPSPARYSPPSVAAPVGPASYGVPNVHAPPMSAQPPGSLFAGGGTLTPAIADALSRSRPQPGPPMSAMQAPRAAPAAATPSRYSPSFTSAPTVASYSAPMQNKAYYGGDTSTAVGGTMTPSLADAISRSRPQQGPPAPQRTASVPTPTARPSYTPQATKTRSVASQPASWSPSAQKAAAKTTASMFTGAVTPNTPLDANYAAAQAPMDFPDDPRMSALASVPGKAALAASKPLFGPTLDPARVVKEAPVAPAAPEPTIQSPTHRKAATVGAPVIGAPAQTGIIDAPFPDAPTAAQIAAAKISGAIHNPLASMGLTTNPFGKLLGGIPGALLGATVGNPLSLGNPFKGLGSMFGPTPNPAKTHYGTGLSAISDILGGGGTAGSTAYSRSTPGYSVTNLGNGMVAKTNQFGHVSYIYAGPNTSLAEAHPGLFGGGIFGGGGGFAGFGSGKDATKSERSSFSGKAGLY
jgi:hypothetical protein